MVEAKHEFIDDNPYLVYSPDAEATASGSGGDAGFPVIEVDSETEALSVTAGELKEMLNNSPVICKKDMAGQIIRWYQITSLFISNNSYDFMSFTTATDAVEVAKWSADTANDYPVLQ